MLADSGRATGGLSQVQADRNTVKSVWSGLSGPFITARSGQGKSAHHSIAADAGSRERAVDTIRTHLDRSYRSHGCAGAERFTPDRPEFRLRRH